MTETISLDGFRALPSYRQLTGKLSLEYSDMSHLSKDEWCKFLEIHLERAPSGSTFSEAEQTFEISVALAEKISKHSQHAYALKDLIKLALTRLGILEPLCYPELLRNLSELVEADGIMLVPDTNVLNNGGMHWLLQLFSRSTVWILPFVLSLTQVQEKDAKLKNLFNNAKGEKEGQKNAKDALRSRAMINSSLGLLQRNKSRYQVLELDPTLLRYHRSTGKDGEGDVLEDRLLIEGIHAILRATRTRAAQRVVTSDVMMARILEAEGVPCLYIPSADLPPSPIPNINYRPMAKAFVGASLADLLWELTHALGSVRIKQGVDTVLMLEAYWPQKNPEEWRNEKLVVSIFDKQLIRVDEAKTSPAIKDGAIMAAADKGDTVLSNAFLPQSSFSQLMRVASYVPKTGITSIESLIQEYGDIDKGNARRSLEILRRLSIIKSQGADLSSAENMSLVERLLAAQELDRLSELFATFSPYTILMENLREHGDLAKSNIEDILRNASDRDVGKESSVRLAKYPILLGQAWTAKVGFISDGSNRPSNEVFLEAFDKSFQAASHDSLAKVQDVLLSLCLELRMSPWAAKRQWQAIAARDGLKKYVMQPAAGQKPIAADKVAGGSLREPAEVPVYVDRIELGERPVFTIEGPSR